MEIEVTIYEDCLNLINTFVECNNPSFKVFCEKWLEAKFQFIYAVQTSTIEVVQTTKAVMYIAKRVACAKEETKRELDMTDNQQLYRRFAGIYLMYAIYFKQPTYLYAKILMSYESWKNLSSFIERLPVTPLTDDVRYIFWNLYKEDAFRFTAHDYDLGLENLADYDRFYDIYNGNSHVDIVRYKLKQKLVAITETEELLPSMIFLEEQYNKTKESLLRADKPGKALPPTTIFKDIQEAIKSIHNILVQKDDEDNATFPRIALSTSEKRKELKRKAAGYLTNDEESQEEEEQSAEGEKLKRNICSRKLMAQELPESIKADLRNNSTDDED